MSSSSLASCLPQLVLSHIYPLLVFSILFLLFSVELPRIHHPLFSSSLSINFYVSGFSFFIFSSCLHHFYIFSIPLPRPHIPLLSFTLFVVLYSPFLFLPFLFLASLCFLYLTSFPSLSTSFSFSFFINSSVYLFHRLVFTVLLPLFLSL